MILGPRRFYQRSSTDCLLACLECYLQRPREEIGQESLAFHPGGYLTYGSVSRILNQPNSPPSYLLTRSESIDTILKQPVPMILGIRLPHVATGTALHSVYWDGGRVWEPSLHRYMKEDLLALKVLYAVVAAQESRYTGPRHSIEMMVKMDPPSGRLTEQETLKLDQQERSGAMYLRVVADSS